MIVRVAAALSVAGAVHAVVNARLLHRPVPGGVAGIPVLVPARDEASQIAGCVRAIDGDVVVLDDGSTDDTACIAARAGAVVVSGVDPPPGWLGKPWACAQLVTASDAEILVFVDADVRLAAGAVAAAATAMGDADLASVFPRQHADGAARLVQPLLSWTWLTTLPLRLAERSARPSPTAACGQFLLVRREPLQRAGGFEAVRDDVLDDIALARAIKASGGRVRVIGGRDLATARMYGNWSEVRDGYGKSLWAAFGSPAGALAVVVGTVVVWVLPAAAALRGSRVGLVGYLAGVVSRVVAGRVAGDRVWPDAFAHPVSVLAFGYLTLRSLRERRRGTLRWKGRPV